MTKAPAAPDPAPSGDGAETPFAEPSSLPFSLPPFASIRTEHFLPAFTAGMAEQRAEVEAIATRAEPPTFANTVEALERSGRLLHRVSAVFFNLTLSNGTDELNAVEAQVTPLLAAHSDAIHLDRRLFARIADLHDRRDTLDLDGEQRRLLERHHTTFVRAGAALDDARMERLRAVNADLATLGTEFKTRLQADTTDLAVHVTDPAELDGLDAGAIAAAQDAARGRGLDGYLLTLALPSHQPALESLRHRGLRQRLLTASLSRCSRGNAHDTREVIVRIARLRAERAELLGYPHHAAYVIADQCAGSAEAVAERLAALAGPAVANARAEAAELTRTFAADLPDGVLRPWDWAYLAGRLRDVRFSLDTAGLRPWFELRRVVEDGIFHAANLLYGLTFHRRDDVIAYTDAVDVYEVRAEGGAAIGLFLADWYTRDVKMGGAWMSTFVDQSRLLAQPPVVVVNLNLAKPPAGEPTLLTLEEVDTAFHEFGHALHGLLSDVTYPTLTGTEVPQDFVEFPSQVNEMWAFWPSVVERYARHHVTGEPLPPETIGAARAARRFGQGFATTEYLAAALLDQAWHRLGAAEAALLTADDIEQFERDALRRNGIDDDVAALIPPRYRTAYFQHVFSGGYSAAYYSYIWSEVMDADLVAWFEETDGSPAALREAGRRFADGVLSRGNSVDPLAAFVSVRGREPRIEPLLARRGLLATTAPA